MRGFFANLTENQKRAALAYRGEENHGDERFKRRDNMAYAAYTKITVEQTKTNICGIMAQTPQGRG